MSYRKLFQELALERNFQVLSYTHREQRGPY